MVATWGDVGVGAGFYFGVLKMFGNWREQVVTQQCDALDATTLSTLKWLILYHVNVTSI